MPTSNDILRGTSLHVRRQISDLLDSLIPASGAAPKDAEYIVGSANATLTAERVATSTTSITVDLGTAAQALWKRAALTGDITAPADSNATTLATVNSNVGTFGSATKVAVVTVTAKGLTIAVTEATISASGSGWTYSVKSANFNAAKDFCYAIDTNSVTATLPASPTAGDRIRFIIEAGVTGFTAARNGNEIMNATNDLTQTYTPYAFELIYNANNGWVLI